MLVLCLTEGPADRTRFCAKPEHDSSLKLSETVVLVGEGIWCDFLRSGKKARGEGFSFEKSYLLL